MILHIQLEIEADYYRFMLLFVHVFSTWPPTCVFVFVQSVQWQESLQFVMNSKIWVKAPSHDYLEDRREEKDEEIIEARLFPTSSCDYVSQTSVPQTHTTFRSILIGSSFLKET